MGFIRRCIDEYASVAQYVVDWQNGLFTIEREDYERMPNRLMRVLRIYQGVKWEIAQKNKRKAEQDRANKP